MNETKSERLAKEITDFCKERLQTPVKKPKGAKSILQTALVFFLTLAFGSSGTDADHGPFW
jgi:hypothetical protein